MTLKESQRKRLRGLGHQLKPVLTIGSAGLTDAVRQEFETTIAHHELIKVRVRSGDRAQRDEIIRGLSEQGQTELVARIGNVALLYRRNPEQSKIALPG